MKANQKFMMDEEAVSPVIAVILMVAITVVLAATVFVLVSDLGGDVGQSSPKLQVVTDSTSRANNWIVKVTDATRAASLADYQVIHTTPDDGTIVYTLADVTTFNTGTAPQNVYSGDLETGAANDDTVTAADTSTANPATTDVEGYRLQFTDVSGDDLWNVLDTMKVGYYAPASTDGTWDDNIPKGVHKIEFKHVPSGGISATITNSF